MRKIGFVSLVMGLFLASGVGATPIDSVTFGEHTIELLSKNVFDGEFYVWTYKVTSSSGPAISHWVLNLCTDYFDHANEDWDEHGLDPTTGVTGTKFDTGYEDDEMREVKLYMTKALEAVEVEMSVGLKAGGDNYVGSILAPSCECEEVPEPTTMALLAAGIAAMAGRRKRLL